MSTIEHRRAALASQAAERGVRGRSTLIAALLLCSAAACPAPELWERETIQLGVADDLNAMFLDDREEPGAALYIVGANGLALRLADGQTRAWRPGGVDLRGLAGDAKGRVFTVGDEGVILASDDRGEIAIAGPRSHGGGGPERGCRARLHAHPGRQD